MFNQEQWKPVYIYNLSEKYSISNYGRVLNQKTNRILKQYINDKGYFIVGLYLNSKHHKHFRVHRLVALAFLDSPTENRNHINHIDGIKTNNHISNLEWVTPKENSIHSWKMGMSYNNRLGKHHTLKIKKIISESSIKRYQNPEARAKHSSIMKQRFQDPIMKKKHSDAIKFDWFKKKNKLYITSWMNIIINTNSLHNIKLTTYKKLK